MEKITPIFSYDYNTDGWVPLVCHECGLCNDSKKVVTPRFVVSMLGKRFIKSVLEIICTNVLNGDYVFKKELIKLLKDEVFFSPEDLAETITSHCQGRGYRINEECVLKLIYSKLGYSAFRMVEHPPEYT